MYFSPTLDITVALFVFLPDFFAGGHPSPLRGAGAPPLTIVVGERHLFSLSFFIFKLKFFIVFTLAVFMLFVSTRPPTIFIWGGALFLNAPPCSPPWAPPTMAHWARAGAHGGKEGKGGNGGNGPYGLSAGTISNLISKYR